MSKVVIVGDLTNSVKDMIVVNMESEMVKKITSTGNVNVALCGAGIVGGGVLYMIKQLRNSPFTVKKVLVRTIDKVRDFELPNGTTYTTDWNECVDPNEIDLVVELIGGITVAKDIVFTALKNNINVVTANKALIASHMEELEEILTTSKGTLGYEAAVGGGIPIIKALQTSIVCSDQVTSVSGILNGTTNFMLSKMATDGCSYDDVLKEAQSLGFAEADPTADVEGHDARAKTTILARLALGCRISESDIPCVGISSLTKDDFNYAKTLNSTIKLVGSVRKSSDTIVQVFVTPCVCPMSGIIANVNGATNVVQIVSDALGTSYLIGAGAGRFPTANSVVADMIDIVSSSEEQPFPVPLNNNMIQDPDYTSRFYVRLNIRDQTGIIMTAGKLCHDNGVSIHAVLQDPIENPDNVPFVITTEECRRSQVEAFAKSCGQEDWCLSNPLIMPILEE